MIVPLFRLSFLSTTLALAGCALQPAGIAQGNQRAMRLATWNLEHLAEANGQGCRPRTNADYEVLRAHAERLSADVVAFQEVESEEAALRVFPSDQWTIVMSNRPANAREGICRGTSGSKIRTQDTGFAIRKTVPFTRNADLATLGLGNPDLRWGVDVTLNLPKPIRLLSVHLKSGCNINRDPKDRDCDILFAQAPILEGWIDARASAGEDFAVMGDWNRRTATAGEAFLGIVSDDDPPAGRLVFTNTGRGATCIKRYPDFIDHIAVGGEAARRLLPNSFVEYLYGVPEELYPSDHCPSMVAVSAS